VWFQKIIELIQHNAGPDPHAAFFEVEIGDLAVVAREFNDQSVANRVAHQTCAGTSGRHRKTRISCCPNDEACLFGAFRKRRAYRLDLINGRVSRIELPRQIIKARVATGLLDFPFLRGSHPFKTTLARVPL
jgi:hypothetical protein